MEVPKAGVTPALHCIKSLRVLHEAIVSEKVKSFATMQTHASIFMHTFLINSCWLKCFFLAPHTHTQ